MGKNTVAEQMNAGKTMFVIETPSNLPSLSRVQTIAAC